jgi:4-amino-4-deoxy-L-arabinose transferase-like glycosyltransferase
LMGEPRLRKPPLVTWLTMAGLSPVDVSAAGTAAATESWWSRVYWLSRLQLLPVMVGIALATAWLCRRLLGSREAWIAAGVVLSCFLFLRFVRNVTTDIYLMLWVGLMQCCIAAGYLSAQDRARWGWALLAGAIGGLAFMTKGPVMLVQTLLPWLVIAATDRRWSGGGAARTTTALLIGAAVGLPWFAWVLASNPQVTSTWATEVSRVDATGLGPDHPLKYFALPGFVFPWTVFFVVGLITAWRRLRVPIVLMVVPLAVMSLFPDRKERYMLPMLMPAALIVSAGVSAWASSWSSANAADRLVRWLHLLCLLVVVLGLPVGGRWVLRDIDGGPFLTTSMALSAGVVMSVMWLATWRVSNRWPHAVVWGGVGIMLVAQVAGVWGYRNSREGRSEMKPLADAILNVKPDASVYHFSEIGRQAPSDLGIYLGRVVRSLPSIDAMPQDDARAVLVLRERRGVASTQTTGLKLLARVRRDNDFWSAWTLEADAGASR